MNDPIYLAVDLNTGDAVIGEDGLVICNVYESICIMQCELVQATNYKVIAIDEVTFTRIVGVWTTR